MNTNEIVEKIIGGYRIKRNDNSLIEHLKNVILTNFWLEQISLEWNLKENLLIYVL